MVSKRLSREAGHPRKYYALTEPGRFRLRQMAEAWANFAGGLSQLLEPVLNHHAADQPHVGAVEKKESSR